MINTWNESTLHKTIKEKYADQKDHLEVEIAGKIVDIFKSDSIIEIQTANLSSIKRKLEFLLNLFPVKLVYPLIRKKRITVVDNDGSIIRSRMSNKTGSILDIFKEVIFIPQLFLYPDFSLDILQVDVEEIRCDDGKGSWRRKGISIKDRIVNDILPVRIINDADDLYQLLPIDIYDSIDSKKIAELLNVKTNLAQKIIYFFKHTGVIYPVDKIGNLKIYNYSSGACHEL